MEDRYMLLLHEPGALIVTPAITQEIADELECKVLYTGSKEVCQLKAFAYVYSETAKKVEGQQVADDLINSALNG